MATTLEASASREELKAHRIALFKAVAGGHEAVRRYVAEHAPRYCSLTIGKCGNGSGRLSDIIADKDHPFTVGEVIRMMAGRKIKVSHAWRRCGHTNEPTSVRAKPFGFAGDFRDDDLYRDLHALAEEHLNTFWTDFVALGGQ